MKVKKKERASVKEYLQFNELISYFFSKKGKEEKPDFGVKSMHFVNKFSMLVFLIAMIYLIMKYLL